MFQLTGTGYCCWCCIRCTLLLRIYNLITKLNLKTPGREEDNEETKLFSKADYPKAKKVMMLLLQSLMQKVK